MPCVPELVTIENTVAYSWSMTGTFFGNYQAECIKRNGEKDATETPNIAGHQQGHDNGGRAQVGNLRFYNGLIPPFAQLSPSFALVLNRSTASL
jgi:hypothetical protein